jgi:hypothetical protein
LAIFQSIRVSHRFTSEYQRKIYFYRITQTRRSFRVMLKQQPVDEYYSVNN